MRYFSTKNYAIRAARTAVQTNFDMNKGPDVAHDADPATMPTAQRWPIDRVTALSEPNPSYETDADRRAKGTWYAVIFVRHNPKDEPTEEDLKGLDGFSINLEPYTEEELAEIAAKPAATGGTRNPATKSTAESPVKLVWATCDEMPGAARKDIIAACVDKGINPSTAATQYAKWKKSKAG